MVRRILVDTSALLALLDRDDPRHGDVRHVLVGVRDDVLITHGYVVAESLAVAGRRFGVAGATALIDGLLPIVNIEFVGVEAHHAALAAYRASLPSGVSFVDRVTLQILADARIDAVFALDPDLATAGVPLLP